MSSDDRLRGLLDSPLDEPPRRDRSDRSAGGFGSLWFVAAMVVGAAIVLLGYLLGGRATTAAPAVDTSTTTISERAEPGLPPGFVAMDGPFGGRVERVLFGPTGVFVTVSTVTMVGVDGETSAFAGGAWDLVLADGSRISSTDQFSDALLPGYLTVRFEPGSYGPDQVDAIQYVALGIQTTEQISLNVGEHTFADDGTAFESTEAFEHPVADGASFAVSNLEITPGGGRLEWSISGPGEPTARPAILVWAASPDGQGWFLTSRSGQEHFFGFGFGNMDIAQSTWQGGGEVILLSPDRGPIPTGVPMVLTIDAQVTWVSFTPVDAPPIPIGDAPVAVVE